jgi:arginine decarboxylase-like protein
MKSFKQFREECGCDEKEKKVKSKLKNKKSGNVEVMPNLPDGQKGSTTKVTNESVFAGNYQGPLYARHPDLVKDKKESFEGGVQKARRDHRSGTLLTFKQFLVKLTDILDEWEK